MFIHQMKSRVNRGWFKYAPRRGSKPKRGNPLGSIVGITSKGNGIGLPPPPLLLAPVCAGQFPGELICHCCPSGPPFFFKEYSSPDEIIVSS